MARTVSSGPHLITTAPSLITCAGCKVPIMAATVSGLDVHVGTETLNRLGELGALLEGRMTYELRQDKLIPRSQYRIRADWPQAPVLAQHACRPVPPEHIDQAWSLAGMAIVIQAIGGVILNDNHSAEPPF